MPITYSPPRKCMGTVHESFQPPARLGIKIASVLGIPFAIGKKTHLVCGSLPLGPWNSMGIFLQKKRGEEISQEVLGLPLVKKQISWGSFGLQPDEFRMGCQWEAFMKSVVIPKLANAFCNTDGKQADLDSYTPSSDEDSDRRSSTDDDSEPESEDSVYYVKQELADSSDESEVETSNQDFEDRESQPTGSNNPSENSKQPLKRKRKSVDQNLREGSNPSDEKMFSIKCKTGCTNELQYFLPKTPINSVSCCSVNNGKGNCNNSEIRIPGLPFFLRLKGLIVLKKGEAFEPYIADPTPWYSWKAKNFQFGQLYIQLPSYFSGGDVELMDENNGATFPWTTPQLNFERMHFLAFHNEVEVNSSSIIKEGVRTLLHYELIAKDGRPGRNKIKYPKPEPVMLKEFAERWKLLDETEQVVVFSSYYVPGITAKCGVTIVKGKYCEKADKFVAKRFYHKSKKIGSKIKFPFVIHPVKNFIGALQSSLYWDGRGEVRALAVFPDGTVFN